MSDLSNFLLQLSAPTSDPQSQLASAPIPLASVDANDNHHNAPSFLFSSSVKDQTWAAAPATTPQNSTTASASASRPDASAVESTDDLSALPRLRESIRRHVEETIQTLPAPETAAYLEAKTNAPEIVARESDPLQFVRYEGYNVWKGARRLCRYWTHRKDIFRDTQFYQPLLVTGTGALNHQELLTLQAGYPAILPHVAQTQQQVVLFDRRKWLPTATAEHKLKCIFYVFMLLAQDAGAQIDGVVCLAVLGTPRFQGFEWDWMHKSMQIASSCFPVKVHFHLLSIPHQKKTNIIKDLIQSTLKSMLKYWENPIRFHTEDNPGQIVEELQALGLEKKNIPISFGGDWKFEDGAEFWKKREQFERANFAPPVAAAASATPSSQPRGTPPIHRKRGRPPLNMSPEEKAMKRRMNDILNSRRKRERKKTELQSLREESSQLLKDHWRLKAEQARLQELLSRAEEISAAELSSQDSRKPPPRATFS